jgi:hypothetical protein
MAPQWDEAFPNHSADYRFITRIGPLDVWHDVEWRNQSHLIIIWANQPGNYAIVAPDESGAHHAQILRDKFPQYEDQLYAMLAMVNT